MKATYRVKNKVGETVGFMVDGRFYNNSIVKQNINSIDNLSVLKNGTIRAKRTLSDIQYVDIFTRRKYTEIVTKNPFIRDIANELKKWKKNNYNSILQIEGARQIGKTTEILKFAYSNYEYVIYVNMANDDYNFEYCIKQNVIHLEICKYCERANLPTFNNSRSTVIIIDEIQENAKVFNALRTLRSEVNCDIIITGSYLGTLTANFTKEGNKKVFFSMGTVMPITMFNMSFREFCRAFNKEDMLMNIDVHGSSAQSDYQELTKLYRLYCSIGGYPSVVLKYKETKSIQECYKLIRILLSIFQQESAKYFTEPKQLVIFDFVYKQAIVEMLTEKRGNGKNMIADISEFINKHSKTFVTRDEVSNAIVWLKKCNIISSCSMVEKTNFKNKQHDRRIYFLDCGIASYLMNDLMIDEAAKRGLIAETFVFCELNRLFFEDYSHKKVKDDLCFSIYNQYELDFVVVGKGVGIENTVFGIEVKAKKGSHESLNVYIERGFVDKGVLAEISQGGHGPKFDTIPIYTIGARFPYK